MFAWMNREALAQTAARGQAVYWSRSRQRLWHKGEESGHIQQVHEIRMDCDNDVVLLKVTQLGHEPGLDRLPHRPPQLLLPAPARAAQWHAVEPVLKDPESDLPMSGNDTLARLAGVIESRRGGDPDEELRRALVFQGHRRHLEEGRRRGDRGRDGRQGR